MANSFNDLNVLLKDYTVNSKVYDSFVMGLGLFVGMTLLGKNTFKAVEKVATQAVSSAVPDA